MSFDFPLGGHLHETQFAQDQRWMGGFCDLGGICDDRKTLMSWGNSVIRVLLCDGEFHVWGDLRLYDGETLL